MHASCILGGACDASVVPVPSSVGGRQSWDGRHPLASVCEVAVAGVPGLVAADILRPGRQPPQRLKAASGGYDVAGDVVVAGKTVVVVDDMFVSGSRALSAAAALTAAGAQVAAVVPLGRLVRPDHNEATEAFYAARSLHAFDPRRCVRCSSTRRGSHALAWPEQTTRVLERLAA